MSFWTIFLFFAIGFFNSGVVSLILALMIRNYIYEYLFGSILFATGLFIVLFSVFKIENYIFRFIYSIISLFSFMGGTSIFLFDSDYHQTSSFLNRSSTYFFVTSSYSMLLSIFIPKIINCIHSSRDSIEKEKQLLLFSMISLFNAFIVSLIVPIAPPSTRTIMSKNVILFSIPGWIIGGITFTFCWILLEKKRKTSNQETLTATSKISSQEPL